ncbi:MAG: HDOD domain-containing protein [Planctomycetota bacterium]|jgi:HD-like signal output (HDOD) protein
MSPQTSTLEDLDGPAGPRQAPLEELFARIGEVSSLPDVALQIMNVTNDPNTGADDLLETIRSDPALAMRLMRSVNSSYYALRSKVADLKQAITLLGLDEIKSLALTAFVAPLFRQTSGYGEYSRRGLWSHMVGTGKAAQLIAEKCRRGQLQEAYLAGLLHDIGLILIDQHLHGQFCRIIDAMTEETPLCEVETTVLGFDHTALGQYVAARWNLPEHLTAAIGHHHSPDRYDGPNRDTVSMVALADFLCHRRGMSPLGISGTHVPVAPLLTELHLNRQSFSQIVEQLDAVLTAADELASMQLR